MRRPDARRPNPASVLSLGVAIMLCVATVATTPLQAEAQPLENGPLVHVVGRGVNLSGAIYGDIYVTEVDGSSSRLVAGGDFAHVDVSPDGRTVLATDGQSGAVVTIDLRTGAQETLVPSGASSAVWLDDGSGYAYVTGNLVVVQEGVSNEIELFGGFSIMDWSPVASEALVVTSMFDGFQWTELLSVDSETGDTTTSWAGGSFDFRIPGADFAPDGDRVVYGIAHTTDHDSQIRIVADEASSVFRENDVTRPSGHVTWSPDGQALAFPREVIGRGYQMVIRDLETGDNTYIGIPGPGSVDWAVQPANGGPFDDVPSDDVYSGVISFIAERGITKGCNPPDNTLFCPDALVTRGQMAAFLVRSLGYADPGGGDLFVDDDGSVFESDIDRLAVAGVTRGCNPPANTRFCPDSSITRGEMAALLARAFQLPAGTADHFVDDDESIFESDIDRIAEVGVAVGCNPPQNVQFCPEDPVTRSQMAAFLARALTG